MSGYQLSRQNLSWVFPYHPASIKYSRKRASGAPRKTPTTRKMLERQALLAKTWDDHKAKNSGMEDKAFSKEWQKLRAAALEKAGMGVPFRSWE